MVVISKEIMQAYNWNQRRMIPAQCLAIPVHSRLLKDACNGVLIDFLKSSGCYRSRQLSQIAGLGNTQIDIQMVQVQQELLRVNGLKLNDDFYKMHLNNLIVSFLLYSSLCYVQTEGANGIDSYYVTKQIAIIDSLKPNIISKDIAKINKDYFADRYKTELSELTEAKHKVITIRPDADGYHLGKGILYSNGKNTLVYPAYMIRGYKQTLLGVLKSKVVRITCLDNNDGDIKFVTSLNADALCRWMRTSHTSQCQPIWKRVEDSYCEANLTLPNFNTPNELITINLLHIKNVEIR